MTGIITHATVTGAAADPTAKVDGPAWDASHTITGVFTPSQGGTGIANNDSSTLTISGSFGTIFTITAATAVTLPTSGTLATLAGSEELTNKTLTSSIAKGTWTASGTWTIPAVTLGGAISGGGKNVDNVIIGANTPLAITGTTLTANTSLTSPILKSGSALQFQSNGSAFAGNINTSQQWSIGANTAPPQAATKLQVSNNAATLPALPSSLAPTVNICAADGVRTALSLQGFGGVGEPSLLLMAANGTGASPASTISGDYMCEIFAHGYTTVNTPGYGFGAGAGFIFRATDNFTDVAQGEEIDVWCTPTGTATAAKAATFKQLGSLELGPNTPLSASGTGRTLTIWGARAGTGGGSAILFSNTTDGGVSAIGHASTILATSYDATLLLYSQTSAYRFNGLTAGLLTSSANGTVSVTAMGSGVATFLTTPSSANLKTAITDETGTGGALVFATAPTISQPNIVGTTTNDNATNGSVGEYISANIPFASATVTMTIASPCVVTWSSIPYTGTAGGGNWTAPFSVTTSGSLATGVTASTQYWIIGSTVSGNTFQIATSIANAFAGTAINTSGTQSGTHTGLTTVALTNNIAANVTAISLTAGDWDVWGNVSYNPNAATTSSFYGGWTSTTSATSPTSPNFGGYSDSRATFAAGNAAITSAGFQRLSLSGTTTVYLGTISTFAVNTNAAFGFIGARRVR